MRSLLSFVAAIAALAQCVPALAIAQDEAPTSITDELKALADRVRPAVVRIAADTAYGSGFAVEDGSVVVTAWHVVDGAEVIWVETADGHEVRATVVDWDKKADAALLQLDEPITDQPLELSEVVPEVGDTLFAMGHPLIGGGLRFDMSRAFIDIGATLDPLDPANTVGVGFTFGLRFGPR